MTRYTTLLVDLDHTLLDSDASEAAAYGLTMRSIGLDEPAQYFGLYKQINDALWASVERGEIGPNEVRTERFVRFLAETGCEGDAAAMGDTFVHGLAENGALYDGVVELLDVLAEHATLAMVTNGIGHVQRRRVERLGLDRWFGVLAISGELGVAKPKPGIFDWVLDQVGTPDHDRTVMIGDSLTSDIRGGADYGLATAWYNRHGKPKPADGSVTHEFREVPAIAAIVAS